MRMRIVCWSIKCGSWFGFNVMCCCLVMPTHLSLNLLKTMGKSKDNSIHTIRIFWAAYSSYNRVLCRYADTFLYLHPHIYFGAENKHKCSHFFGCLPYNLLVQFSFSKSHKRKIMLHCTTQISSYTSTNNSYTSWSKNRHCGKLFEYLMRKT